MTRERPVERPRLRTAPLLGAWALVVAANLAGSAALAAETPSAAGADRRERLARLVERLDQEREEQHIPGMALAIVQDDQVILSHGFGLADRERRTPVTPETLFAAGSTTKAFTATLVGMLVDAGKMSWDEPVSEYLPYFTLQPRSGAGDPITLRDALSHRSGFARMSMLWAGGEVPRKDVLRTASRAQPWADHRASFHYNNVMYLAAGEAAAKAGRRSWERLVRRRILEPLQMNDSSTDISVARKDSRLAVGYEWDRDREEYKVKEMRDLKAIAPAGAINSNVIDMAKWVRFQLAGGVTPEGERLISEASQAELRTPQIELGGEIAYGLGWFLRKWNGMDVVEHGGNIDGFAAQIALLPEKNTGFVLLANVSGMPLQQGSMPLVWDALFSDDPESDAVGEASVANLDGYTGDYTANFGAFENATFTVSSSDGRLAVDVPGQQNYTLKSPDDDGKWFFELTDTIAVSFDRDADGQVVALRLHQAGFDFELPRKGVEVPPEIPLDELEPFLGVYRSDQAEYRVLIQNNRLAVDPPAPIVFELHPPLDDGRRVARIRPDRSIRFNRDEEGRIVSFTRFREGEEADTAIRVAGEDEEVLPTLSQLATLRRIDERRAAYANLGAVRETGKVVFENAGIEGRMTNVYRGVDRHRMDMDLGRFGWISNALDGDYATSGASTVATEQLFGVRLAQAKQNHPAVLGGDWRDSFDEVRVVKADRFADRKTWVVRLEEEDVPPLTLQVDAETGDILHTTTIVEIAGGAASIPVEVRYEDYRERLGLRIPHRVTITNVGNGHVVLTTENIESEVQLPAGYFRLELE